MLYQSAMKYAPIKEKVITEGAEIYCERRGNGPLLLLITGGMGDAGFYSSAADILADVFTVVSYDRRSNSSSTGDRTTDMTVAQQARDAAANIKAMGRTRLSFLEVAEAALSVLSWQQPNRK
jgi:pimeloyl-ACP methyl ester carboxylesterase